MSEHLCESSAPLFNNSQSKYTPKSETVVLVHQLSAAKWGELETRNTVLLLGVLGL